MLERELANVASLVMTLEDETLTSDLFEFLFECCGPCTMRLLEYNKSCQEEEKTVVALS